MSESLLPILVLLATGICSVVFLPRAGISPIVGFLFAGLMLGGGGMLDLIPQGPLLHILAEFGVVFLMFEIGLHFSLQRLWLARRDIFLLGGAQVGLTGVLLSLVLWFFMPDSTTALVVGLALALSSTAVCTQLITERGDKSPPVDSVMAILIFQDVFAIFLMILGSNGSADGGSLPLLIVVSLVKCALSIGAALLIGRYLARPVFAMFTGQDRREAFTMAVLFIVLITSMATQAAGLSLTLGAFLSGMIIAKTPFKYAVQAEIKPFRNLLLSLFFVSVGLTIDLGTLITSWVMVLGFAAIIVVVKMAASYALFRSMGGKPKHIAMGQAALLCQGSEFLFVIIGLPEVAKVVPVHTASALVAAVALTMAGTSFIFDFVWRTYSGQESALPGAATSTPKEARVMVIGMNDVAQTLADALAAHHINFIIIEGRYTAFEDGRKKGLPVVYGDRADLRLWDSIGIKNYNIMAVAEPAFESARMYNDLPLEYALHIIRFIAVKDEVEAAKYNALNNYGRTFVTNGYPRGLEMAMAILSYLGVDATAVSDWAQAYQRSRLDQKSPRQKKKAPQLITPAAV